MHSPAGSNAGGGTRRLQLPSIKGGVLDHSGKLLGTTAVRALAANPALKKARSIKLSGCGLKENAMAILVPALEEARELSSLDLSHNVFGVRGAVHIANMLKNGKNSQLSSLDISCNEISDDGMVAFARAIRSCWLCKDGQEFTPAGTGWSLNPKFELCPETEPRYQHQDGFIDPAECTEDPGVPLEPFTDECKWCGKTREDHRLSQHNQRLTSINISGNPIGLVGAQEIARTVAGSPPYDSSAWMRERGLSPHVLPIDTLTFSGLDHLKAVTMERNMLRAEFTAAGMGPQGAVIIAAFLSYCPLLVSMDLSDNELGVSGAQYLATGLWNNQSAYFSKLRLEGNWIGDPGKEALGEAIRGNGGIQIQYMVTDGWALLGDTRGGRPEERWKKREEKEGSSERRGG
jgi:hypothetical protein